MEVTNSTYFVGLLGGEREVLYATIFIKSYSPSWNLKLTAKKKLHGSERGKTITWN